MTHQLDSRATDHSDTKPTALFIRATRSPGPPWWWRHLNHESLGCRLVHEAILLDGGRPSRVLSWPFIVMGLTAVRVLLRARHRDVRYIFTVECDWLSFLIAGLQTLLMFRTPRHVIVQFIMRERTDAVRSRLKYAFMRWCFRSVHLSICSSRSEARYYAQTFGWTTDKAAYVPILTDPSFIQRGAATEQGYVISAGRTFRDYDTLLEAFRECPVPLRIVGTVESTIASTSIPRHVTLEGDVPLAELSQLMARSLLVVLPLQDRQISIGQSVLLAAMAMGKAVIVTSVNGTVDYVEHMKTGILVPPKDPKAIRDAVRLLMDDHDLRRRIGHAAREQVLREHLPDHYAQGIARRLRAVR